MDAVFWGALSFINFFAASASARQIEIIHTNDLHSHFERANDPDQGGYAAIKGVMDRLKSQAARQGIESLQLDAGDFSEGTPFFIARQGQDSWKMIQSMGYDAIAIGNHDWFIGASQMEKIVTELNPTVPFLSANLKINPRYSRLNQAIRPHAEFIRSGLKIAVVGLATDELIYQWMVRDGKITSPYAAMKNELKHLRSRNDLVIALTHLGVKVDQKLAQKVDGVDLIVGGHSHTVLPEPIFEKNPRGVEVPIVQTGAHGQYVGDLLIDYEPGKPVKVVHYRLIPVKKDFEVDEAIHHQVQEAREDLESVYTPQWLYQKVADSQVPMEIPVEHPTVWGNFYTDAMREAVGADMALNDSQFFGLSQPAGPINRESLLTFFPHYFDVTKPTGWTVWTIRAPGWEIAAVLSAVVKAGTFFNLSQCEYDVKLDANGKPHLRNLRIAGKKVNYLKNYTIAVSEGIGKTAQNIVGGLARFLTHPRDHSIPVWTAVEEKIARDPAALQNLKLMVPHRLPAEVKWSPASFNLLVQ
jgi:5'-nucleotidase/UDP-sugar diphosphatase